MSGCCDAVAEHQPPSRNFPSGTRNLPLLVFALVSLAIAGMGRNITAEQPLPAPSAPFSCGRGGTPKLKNCAEAGPTMLQQGDRNKPARPRACLQSSSPERKIEACAILYRPAQSNLDNGTLKDWFQCPVFFRTNQNRADDIPTPDHNHPKMPSIKAFIGGQRYLGSATLTSGSGTSLSAVQRHVRRVGAPRK